MKSVEGRFEFKYLLDESTTRRVSDYINKIHLQKDTSQGGTYTVTSLYFDTPDLNDYYDKLGGFMQRQKLRARVYSRFFSDHAVKEIQLEVKKKNDARTFKDVGKITIQNWDEFYKTFSVPALLRGAAAGDGELSRFLDLYIRKCYKPNVVVRYKRRAFVGIFLSKFRLTLDSDIEACRAHRFGNHELMTPIFKGYTVMEVKFRKAMPWWFKDMVYRFGLERTVFSKYANSLAVIHGFNLLPR